MRVLYVGTFQSNQDSAGLQRVIGNSAAIAEAGHQVEIVGQGSHSASRILPRGVTLSGFGDVRNLSRAKRVYGGYGFRTWLDSIGKTPDIVIAYGGTSIFSRILEKWTKKNGVARVIDSVEWYDRRHMDGGRLGPKALDNEYLMRVRYPKYDGAIAISRYLEQHYRNCQTPTLRLPPLVDVRSFAPVAKAERGPLRVVYAGSPGKKDGIGRLVRAFQSVDPIGERIQLDVVGVSEETARSLPEMPSEWGASVKFSGRMARLEALEKVMEADYIPMIRPDERFAHAGFPTKVVESMAVGTAVIGNHTSDLSEHILDQKTGLVVPDDSVESLVDGLNRAVAGGKKLSKTLGDGARTHAEMAFDYRNYSTEVSSWLDGISRGI